MTPSKMADIFMAEINAGDPNHFATKWDDPPSIQSSFVLRLKFWDMRDDGQQNPP